MSRYNRFVASSIVIAILLLTESALFAGEHFAGESVAEPTIDIYATGNVQVQISAGDGEVVNVSAQAVGVTHFHFSSAPETDFNVSITGEGRVDMTVSGHSELNITVKGPIQIHVNAGEEVMVNVEADEESAVYINEQVCDLLAGNRVQELADPGEPEEITAIEENEVQLLSKVVDLQASTTNLKIMAGIIPVLAIAVLFSSIIKKEGKNRPSQRRK